MLDDIKFLLQIQVVEIREIRKICDGGFWRHLYFVSFCATRTPP